MGSLPRSPPLSLCLFLRLVLPLVLPLVLLRACVQLRAHRKVGREVIKAAHQTIGHAVRVRVRVAGFFEMTWRSQMGTGWGPLEFLPEAVKGLLICTIFAPTIPYFTQIWFDQGMYDLMSVMAPQVKYG